jgi:uncharacterized membrane protein YagU involved in acid resistance
MNTYIAGFAAGIIATVVLSALMMLKGMMGMMPDLDVIGMLSSVMGAAAAIGWIAHFVIGAIFGLIFAGVFGAVDKTGAVLRGIGLGIAGWLVMMIVLMPMVGGGVFGLSMPSGMMVPVATLLLHVIFGAVLGVTYAALRSGTTQA